MMKLSSVIRLAFIGIVLIACDDKFDTPRYKYQIEFKHHADELIFTNLPVYFNFSTQPYVEGDTKQVTWSFGDGSTIDARPFTHVYSKPGVYTVSLTSGSEILADTVIEVVPKPPLVGTLQGWEQGHFFYQAENSDYIILYQDGGFYLAVVSESFETKELKPLSYLSNLYFFITARSKNGFVIAESPFVFEIHNNGTLVNKKLFGGAHVKDIIQTSTGHKIICEDYGKVVLRELDHDLVEQTVKTIRDYSFIAYLPQLYFEGPDVIRTHHASSADVDMIVEKLDGTTLLHTSYPAHMATRSFKFQGGYLLAGFEGHGTAEPMYTCYFRITDADGKIIATQTAEALEDIRLTGNGQLPPNVELIERDDFIYIFFGNMQVMKLAKTGEVIWRRTFATEYDRLRSVLVNSKGNFVLMGEHYYDPETQQYTGESARRDIILIEIDAHGNYLFAK